MTETNATRRRDLRLVLPALDGSSTRSRRKRPDRYELVSSQAPKPGGGKPEIHKLVDEYDTRGLRDHLKAHPGEVDKRNAEGDAPLHVIGARGAVLVAEVLDEFSPNHLASNRRGLLGGHLAAEKHPKTAQFLLERALASDGGEASWHPFVEVVARVEKLLGKSTEEIDKVAAELCGIPLTELNAAGEVVKNRTHLEAVKGYVLDLKSEGWWQDKFVPQRVRALLRGAVKAPVKHRTALVREISVQLDLLRSIRRNFATRKCFEASIRELSMTLEARLIVDRLVKADPEKEIPLALGWPGHALYCGMSRVLAKDDAGHPQDTLLIRIDNLGAGVSKSHEKDAGGLVYSRAIHVPYEYFQEHRQEVELFLRDIMLIQATPETCEDDFYSRVARFKSDLKAATGEVDLIESNHRAHDASLPKQIAGNCVVANTFPGLWARLGTETFEWFRTFERDLARDLVKQHADANHLIDDECRERDQREIGRVLGEAGPWAEKLAAIIDGGRSTYDVSSLAKGVTHEQMKRVIEGRDAAALRILLAHGAKAFLQDGNDATPLHWAAAIGDVQLVRALLDAKAPVNAMDADGNTPLHKAVFAHCHPVVALLLERGADVDRENRAKLSPRTWFEQNLGQTMLIGRALRRGDSDDKVRLRAIAP